MDAPSPHSRIHLLSPLLSNQIAAGEVVERPASVIKELLENSLDAGARQIEIEVERGGVRLMRIRDDGGGIHRDDLALALSRHATSKLWEQAQLERVVSLGFRGEALASIASVSRLQLSSRTPEAESGWSVTSETEAPAPAAHPPGTTVEVRDLFYNTPARRKFLRTERTEFGHLEEVVRRAALSRFEVGFTLRHNRKPVLSLPPVVREGERERRIAAVAGRPFLREAQWVEALTPGLRLWGWLTGRDYSRSQADLQYFYINGRMVRDKLVGHAVRQAYRDLLPPGRHPGYVLYLELDPAQVDVNVHPTKHEVRFREARQVHDFIVGALHRELEGGVPARTEVARSAPTDRRVVAVGGERPTLFPPRRGAVAEQNAFYRGAAAGPAGATPSTPKAVALIGGHYALAERAGRTWLVDLNRLERAVRRGRLAAALAGEPMPTRPLLLPLNLSVRPAEVAAVGRHGALLATLGFEFGTLGEESLALRRLPALFADGDAEALARALLGALAEAGSEVRQEGLVAHIAAAAPPTPRRRLDEVETLLHSGGHYGEGADGCWRELDSATLDRLFAEE